MSSMDYYYYINGRCTECNDVLWITENPTPVTCGCSTSILDFNPAGTVNIEAITDTEFKVAIREEHRLDSNVDINLIKL